MSLPQMRYQDKISKVTQTKFSGYQHTAAASEGQIYDMENLSSDDLPLLATRRPRYAVRTLTAPNGLYAWEKLLWVDGTSLYYDGLAVGTVTNTPKTFASLGPLVVILPDKKYYNVNTGEFGSLEATYTSGANKISFANGEDDGIVLPGSDIVTAGAVFPFRAGDAVTVSGCTTFPEHNGTWLISKVSTDKKRLTFSSNLFTVGEEAASVVISRDVPDMDFLFENENRLWGCKADTIYASALGDAFNWYKFPGLDTDAWSVPVGSDGDFTGACAFLGFPCFFKEDNIYKVYGNYPSDYQVMSAAKLGVQSGAHKSLAIAGETLFYLARSGIVAYSGGLPRPISEAFGDVRYTEAVGGTDGLKYYVSMKDRGGNWHLFVYDTQRNVWHREDNTSALDFAYYGGLYCLDTTGGMKLLGNPVTIPGGAVQEPAFPWSMETGDFYENSPDYKGVSKIRLRLELEAGATVTVYIQFDSGQWQTVKTIAVDTKRSVNLPIIPRRCDHYRLKLSGSGGCRVYSLARELYVGSDLQ